MDLCRICILGLLLLPTISFCDVKSDVELLRGKVIGVSDGDTITVLCGEEGKESLKVRLEGIDAPESSQAFGAKSKDALKELVAGKVVDLRKTGVDKYGRSLAFVIVDGVDVNAKLIEDGWAWHYKKYNSDKHFAELEENARADGRGLWHDESPLPPWEFRARKRGDTAPSDNNPTVDAPTSPDQTHWLNLSSNVRHNRTCEYFAKTKRGRYCTADEGKPCGKCGG